jgi:hypothetical protein
VHCLLVDRVPNVAAAALAEDSNESSPVGKAAASAGPGRGHNRHPRGRLYSHVTQYKSISDCLDSLSSVNAELLAMSGPRNPYQGKLGVIEEGALADFAGSREDRREAFTGETTGRVLSCETGLIPLVKPVTGSPKPNHPPDHLAQLSVLLIGKMRPQKFGDR